MKQSSAKHSLSKQAISNKHFDIIVLGGGAAGLMCALTAGQRGMRVLVVEKSNKLGKKILMSGGGRCNFTNLDVQPSNYICPNPHFVKSALTQYTQWDFIAMVEQHGIAYHEKKHGQLFCNDSAKDILQMLVHECEKVGVAFVLNADIDSLDCNNGYQVQLNQNTYSSNSLVLATGGLSIPTLGGSGFAYEYARKLGLTLNQTEASLVPFTLTGDWLEFSKSLAGVSLPIRVSVSNQSFSEDMLFTHRGISGPAILQISNYWHLGEKIEIDLAPNHDVKQLFSARKKSAPNTKLDSVFRDIWPRSFSRAVLTKLVPTLIDKPLQEIKGDTFALLAEQIHQWTIKPSGTEGYRTAEVTRGGIDVAHVSSKTMRANVEDQNLYIIGEALDVTGHLGGFNFQWAWSSGYVAGMNV